MLDIILVEELLVVRRVDLGYSLVLLVPEVVQHVLQVYLSYLFNFEILLFNITIGYYCPSSVNSGYSQCVAGQ